MHSRNACKEKFKEYIIFNQIKLIMIPLHYPCSSLDNTKWSLFWLPKFRGNHMISANQNKVYVFSTGLQLSNEWGYSFYNVQCTLYTKVSVYTVNTCTPYSVRNKHASVTWLLELFRSCNSITEVIVVSFSTWNFKSEISAHWIDIRTANYFR